MLSRIVKIRRRGVKTDPKASKRTMKTPTSTRVVRLKKSEPVEFVRSVTDAVAPPTYITDDPRRGTWLLRRPTFSRLRATAAIAVAEYGSTEVPRQTNDELPAL